MWFVILGIGAVLAYFATGGHPLAWVEGITNKGKEVQQFTRGQKYVVLVFVPKGFSLGALRNEFARDYGQWFGIVAPEQQAGAAPNSDAWYIPVIATQDGSQADVAAMMVRSDLTYQGDIAIQSILGA